MLAERARSRRRNLAAGRGRCRRARGGAAGGAGGAARGRELADAPNGWLRQYVGIVRGGRRFVYGNFFPRSVTRYGDAGRWRREPVMVCDGGPAFFGIEYDVESGTFTQLGFNGLA